MSERARAVTLATWVLEDAGDDPDSDMSILARQFLRCIEAAPATPVIGDRPILRDSLTAEATTCARLHMAHMTDCWDWNGHVARAIERAALAGT